MAHPKRTHRHSSQEKKKRQYPIQPASSLPPSPGSSSHGSQQGWPPSTASAGRHSFDSNQLAIPSLQKYTPPAATVAAPSFFFSLLNNDSNPSGSSTMSAHHAASRSRSPPPSITGANAVSQHMTDINHNLSSSKDRFLYVGKGHQLHPHSAPTTPFAHPVSLSSGAAASLAALSTAPGHSPYHTHHYHTPSSQKRPTHSRRSSYSHNSTGKLTPANGYGEVPDQRQNTGFFNMAIFDPSPDHSRSARSSLDHLQSYHQSHSSIRTASRPPSIESINSSNSVPLAPPPAPPPPFYRRFLNHFSNRVIKRHIKFAVAFYLTSALALVPQIATALGPTPYLANVTVVFMHPSRTVGSMLEATIFSVIGALLAAIWIIPCEVVVAEFNQQHMSANGDTVAWTIEAAWFFIGIWMMTTAKSRYAKLNCAFIMFTIAGIFAFTKNTKATVFDPHNFLDLIGPMLLGVLGSLIVCIVCWPETASQGLGRAFNESLDSSRELLNLCTCSFLLHHKTIAMPKSALEKAQAEVRQAQKKLHNAYRETRYEVTYSRADPADYKEVRVIVSAMMRHLGSMSLVVQNERLLLLGNSQRDDDDLNTASGESASERWLSDGLCCSDSECACSESDSSSDSENDRDPHASRRTSSQRPHDDPEHEANDYFGNVATEAKAAPEDAVSRLQSAFGSTPSKDHHHHHHKRHHHHRHIKNSESGEGVALSDSVGGSGNGHAKTLPKTHRGHRTSAAELRRVRQLLHRAENSTAALLSERQENHRRLRQQQEEQLAQMTQIFQQSGIATAPSTPGGRGLGIYKQYRAQQKKKGKEKGKGKGKERASLTIDGSSSSASSFKDDTFFGTMGMTPFIRSAATSPSSSRPSSIYEEGNLDTVKSFKSLFSTRSVGNKFKPDRPTSLKGFKIGKRRSKKIDEADGHIRSGCSSPVDHTPGIPIDFTRTAPTTLGEYSTEGNFDRRQLAKVALAFHKKELERLKRERKRVSREEKLLRRKFKEEEKRKAEAAETAATDALPPKEVTFGDRKLFMSFLDIVHDPLQRLSTSCSKVMVAMERELVAGLNVENDRLERIRRKNAQRAAALKAAEAKMASEMAAAEGQPLSSTMSPAGMLRQPTMLIKRAMSFGNMMGKHHEQATSSDEIHGGSTDKNATATPANCTPDPKNTRWNAVRSLVGLRRRSFTATEEIEYAHAMSRKNEGNGEGDFKAQEKVISPAHHSGKDDLTKPRPTSQHATMSAGLELGDDEEFFLPADMTYVEFLTQELEKFDLAEAEALRNLVSSHPTLDIGPREEVFLIFFFLFALREIARELLRLGHYVEEMDAKWKEEKRGRKLWWPKVFGNFWQWFAWGSYTQIKTNEGYGSLTVNITKNIEHRQLPRTVEEEKAAFVAKAAKAAKEKAEQEKKRQEAEEAAQKFPPLRRSATFSALVHRRGHANNDIEMGTGDPSERSPRTLLGMRSVSKERGQRRHATFLGFDLPKRPRSQERARRNERTRRLSMGDYIGSKERSRLGARSARDPSNTLTEEPLEIVIETPPKGDDAPGVEEQAKDLPGQNSQQPVTSKYAVAEIPSFAALQQRHHKVQQGGDKGVGPLSPDPQQYSGVTLSPKVDGDNSYSTAPSSVVNEVPSLRSNSSEAGLGGLHLVGVSESSSGSAFMSRRGQAALDVKQATERTAHVRRARDDSIKRALERQEAEIDEEIRCSRELSSDGSDGDDLRQHRRYRPSKRTLSNAFRDKRSKDTIPTSQDQNFQQQRIQEQLAQHEDPRRVFVQVQKPKTTRYRIWEALQFFKSEDFRFGLKMAMALTFIGLWGWLNWTNRVLATDRGQWAMMTVMAVLSPTVGATFSVCLMRIAGTLVGTLWALLTYLALPGNPYVIYAMMLVVVFASAFLILESAHPKLGIIMVISYSSITFIMYEGNTTDTIYELCYQRAITVIVGIIISVIMNSLLWPIMARRELRKEIALLIGRQGVLFAELVNKFLLEDPAQAKAHPFYEREAETLKTYTRGVGESSAGDDSGIEGYDYDNHRQKSPMHPDTVQSPPVSTKGSGNDTKESAERATESSEIDPDRLAFQHVEHQLQTKLIKILQLLELSESEPRLKGKFPMKLYQQIIQCCQNILDRLISMRMAAQLLSPDVRKLVTGPMNYYRRDMVGALLLYFSVLSSSLASKSPLPPYLPSARMARLRVIYNVREAIAAHQAATGEDHYTYIYYYAFSSALEEVIEELELLAILIKPLVGVTAVTTSHGFNYQLSGDQLGLGPAMATTNLHLPPMEQGSVAAVLGSGHNVLGHYGQQESSFLPSHAADNQLLINPDIMIMPGVRDSSVETPPQHLPPINNQRKQINYQTQGTASTLITEPALSATRAKPDIKVVTALKKDDPAYPSSGFVQSPAMMEEKILGGTRQIQRLKEAIEAAQEVSEHHVVQLASPTVAPTSGVGISAPTKARRPSVVNQLASVLSNEIKVPMSPRTPRGQSSRGINTARAGSRSPPLAPFSAAIVKSSKSANETDTPNPMGIVTPFGSGLVPEAPLPLHLIPRHQHNVAQPLAASDTSNTNDMSGSSSNHASRHNSPGDLSYHGYQRPHHHSHLRPTTPEDVPQDERWPQQ